MQTTTDRVDSIAGLQKASPRMDFAPEEKVAVAPWKVLIVDDEPEVHNVTRLVLANFKFEDRPIKFLSAYSGREAIEQIKANPDVAVMLLDVVMETDQAGL